MLSKLIFRRAVEFNTPLLYFIKIYELSYYLFSLVVVYYKTCIFTSKGIKLLRFLYKVYKNVYFDGTYNYAICCIKYV